MDVVGEVVSVVHLGGGGGPQADVAKSHVGQQVGVFLVVGVGGRPRPVAVGDAAERASAASAAAVARGGGGGGGAPVGVGAGRRRGGGTARRGELNLGDLDVADGAMKGCSSVT